MMQFYFSTGFKQIVLFIYYYFFTTIYLWIDCLLRFIVAISDIFIFKHNLLCYFQSSRFYSRLLVGYHICLLKIVFF